MTIMLTIISNHAAATTATAAPAAAAAESPIRQTMLESVREFVRARTPAHTCMHA